MPTLDDSLRTMARRLRGLPRHEIQLALPRRQIAESFVVPDLLSHDSVVYSAGGSGVARFDDHLMMSFGCSVQVLSAPWPGLLEQTERAMQTFGHEHIDLLRLDIEGAEYAALDALSRQPLRPCQLVVEFHHHLPELSIDHTEAALDRLEALGYRIFALSSGGRSCSLALL
jgi:hypothetical protein